LATAAKLTERAARTGRAASTARAGARSCTDICAAAAARRGPSRQLRAWGCRDATPIARTLRPTGADTDAVMPKEAI
jgi:hypothetical protein